MAKLPAIPEPPPGLKGLMTPGVDLGTFQKNTMGNLTSIVSTYSPGKSILGVAKINDAAAAAKSKLSGLKASVGGALGGAVGGVLTGAASGVLSSALSGGKVSLSSIGGTLAGSAAGAVGANLGAAISGTNVSNATGIGAMVGGVAAGALGKSVGSKLAIGAIAGTAVGAVSGLVTGKINSAFGITNSSSGGTTATGEASAPEATAPSEPPDLSKNTTAEITDMADKSPQSVPITPPVVEDKLPVPQTPPNLSTQSSDSQQTTPTVTTNQNTETTEQVFQGKAALLGASGKRASFWASVRFEVIDRYLGLFSGKSFDAQAERMKKDMENLTSTDRQSADITIGNFNGKFSMAYSTVGKESDPGNRVMSYTDFLCLTSENYYQLVTGVAEGSIEIQELSYDKDPRVYTITTSLPSPSKGIITISNKIYGTATAEVQREVPLPMNEFFDWRGMTDTLFLMVYGKPKGPAITDGVWDATKLKSGAYIRMFCATEAKFFGSSKIFTSQKAAGIVTGEKTYNDFDDATSVAGNNIPGWAGKAKGQNNSYYTFIYHPYTLQVSAIIAYKMLSKT